MRTSTAAAPKNSKNRFTFAIIFFLLLFSTALHGENAGNAEPAMDPSAAIEPQNKLPDEPKAQPVVDKKYMFLMGALGGAEATRITSRTMMLDREFDEGAPWVTSRPSYPHIAAKDAAIFAAEAFVTYQIKKPHPWLPGDRVIRKFWWVYPVAMTTLHFKSAMKNIRTQPPAECPMPECEGYQ